MKTKILTCSLAAALTACGIAATGTFAANNIEAVSAHGRLLPRIADRLDLTADQRAQIKDVISAEKDTLAPLLGAVHDARKNLRETIRASDASETTVRAASAKVASAEADFAVERMKLYSKIAPILTDAQREKLAGRQQRADEFADSLINRLGSGL